MNLEKVKSTFDSSQFFQDVLAEMPIFQELLKLYEETKPFTGTSIVIAHVIVPNTLPLIYSCVLGGANVMVTDTIPSVVDDETLALLNESGVSFDHDFINASEYDYAIDCTAYFADYPPKLGICEVTRSGIHRFAEKNMAISILDVDNTDTKKIETFIGNPLAVKRTFDHFVGNSELLLKDQLVAVIGFGKIGRGLARVFSEICRVRIMDVSEEAILKAKSLGYEAQIITEKRANTYFIQNAIMVLTATGHPNVVTTHFNKKKIYANYLINVGAVDEFGDDYSEDEVLMSKHKPFNFNMTPPTGNEYIDPILAIHVDGIRYMIENKLEKGINATPKDLDTYFVNKFEHFNFEIQELLKQYFT